MDDFIGRPNPDQPTWDVLIGGAIQKGVDRQTVAAWLRQRRIDPDDLARRPGEQWQRIGQFPEFSPAMLHPIAPKDRARHNDYAWWKPVAVAVPVSVACGLVASLFDPMLISFAQYASLAMVVVPLYLVFGVGTALVFNYLHLSRLKRGERRGFWRYPNILPAALVVFVLMIVSGCPPFIYIIFASYPLSAIILVGAIVIPFKLIFETGVRFDP